MSEQVAPPRTGAYVDSGVLIKLYVREPNSAAAAHLVTAFPSVKLYPFQSWSEEYPACIVGVPSSPIPTGSRGTRIRA